MNPMGKSDERNCATWTDWLPLSLGEGWLEGLPLRATFSPAHPLADIIHPPYPPIASQSISRDVPFAQAWAFWFFPLRPQGSSQTVLNCAHRTIYMLLPSMLFLSSGMGAD